MKARDHEDHNEQGHQQQADDSARSAGMQWLFRHEDILCRQQRFGHEGKAAVSALLGFKVALSFQSLKEKRAPVHRASDAVPRLRDNKKPPTFGG